jgi:hypothetical protein
MYLIKYVNQTIINLSGLAVDSILYYSGNQQALNGSVVTHPRWQWHNVPSAYREHTWSRDSSDGIAARHGVDGPAIESRCEIFRTRPDLPWGTPSFYCNGYWVYPGGAAVGAWPWPPAPLI